MDEDEWGQIVIQAAINVAASRAEDEVRELVKFARRSLGQTFRWIEADLREWHERYL